MSDISYFDQKMAEHKAERERQRNEKRQVECELEQLQASTEAIREGMGNGGLWLLLGAGIAIAPLTFGAGFLLSIYAGIKMSGGKHMVTDVLPHAVDVVSPGWGFVRILASLLTLVLVIVAVVFVAALVAFEIGVIK